MYAPTYGYGPGNSSSPFNGAPPQPHNPHHQQQPQPGQQPQQHMMYNPQQYAAGGHQSPYGGVSGPGPAMVGNAGAMGLMQNNGMAHMAGGHGELHADSFPYIPYILPF